MNTDTLESLLEEFAPEYRFDGGIWDRELATRLVKAAMFDELVEALEGIRLVAGSYSGCMCDNGEFEAGDCWNCRFQSLAADADEALAKANRIKGVIDDE